MLWLFKGKICLRRTKLTSVSLTDSVSYLLPKMPLSCLKDFLIALSVVFVDFLSFWFLLSGLWRVLSNLMPPSTRLICNTTQFNRGPSRKSRFFPSVVRSACEDVAHNRQSQMHVCMYACMQVLALYWRRVFFQRLIEITKAGRFSSRHLPLSHKLWCESVTEKEEEISHIIR